MSALRLGEEIAKCRIGVREALWSVRRQTELMRIHREIEAQEDTISGCDREIAQLARRRDEAQNRINQLWQQLKW